MKLLLDTHALIWFIEADERFSRRARAAIEQCQEPVFVSVASIWEIAIKSSLGKLSISRPLNDHFKGFLTESGFTLLNIGFLHAVTVQNLPFHHRDPFDRILLAQCIQEGISIISHDASMDPYPVQRVW